MTIETPQGTPAKHPDTPHPSTESGSAPRRSTDGRHVLIVGMNYWPEPTGSAPYTTAIAEHLAKGAASLNVHAGLPYYPAWSVPPQYRRKLRFHEEINGVSLVRLKHFVPTNQDVLRRATHELSFLAHTLVTRPACPPDVVIGITPALGGAVAAALLARRYRTPLVLIVHDLTGQATMQSGIAGGRRIAASVGRLESWALTQADKVVIVSDTFRAQLARYGVRSDRVHTIRNWSRSEGSSADRRATRAHLGWAEDVSVALHTGNMGLKQDLGNIIEAARLSKDQRDLRWVLMGDGSQRRLLQEQAKGLPNVEFLPLCSDDEYQDVLAAADVLLLNERASVQDMSLPSKLTSYFMSGRPVAAAVRSDGATARELANAGAPDEVAPGDPRALLDLVIRLSVSESDRARHGDRALVYAAANLTFAAAMRKLEFCLQETP